jgi:cell filamentation protein
MTGDPYVYPRTTILRNKLGIRDADQLDYVERCLATERATQGIPTGDFRPEAPEGHSPASVSGHL